jgi:RimJ/RimL family protein N-acetyltransferase
LEQWHRFFQQESVLRFLPDRFDTVEDLRSVLRWLISNYDRPLSIITRLTLGIHLRSSSSAPIGFVSYGPLPEDESKRELAYAIHPANTGNGYATEACQEFLRWIAKTFSSTPIYASVDPSNQASLRVVEKLGFVLLSPNCGGMELESSGQLIFVSEPPVNSEPQ